ncbi:MAG: DUF3572 domain-containing protein [Alphaproteobacteria bacterium]
MNLDQAEAMGLEALGYIVADATLRSLFLDLTGMSPEDLRARISDPALLAAAMDFLLGREPSLLQFCAAAEIDPQLPARAHSLLLGPQAPDWS